MDENEESYTSKCDALALETFQDCMNNKSINRIKRGLYSSNAGFLINADVNGAINIMRKHLMKMYPDKIDSLESFIANNSKQFLNPLKIKINEFKTNRLPKLFQVVVSGSYLG